MQVERRERETMILLATVGLVVGALLAQRFRVMVLFPATAVVLLGGIATGVAQAHTAWSFVLLAGTAVISMQIGYLVVGTAIRHVVAGALASRSSHLHAGTASASTRYHAR
jgi:hypothetical protein